jgi:hypothetical protein
MLAAVVGLQIRVTRLKQRLRAVLAVAVQVAMGLVPLMLLMVLQISVVGEVVQGTQPQQ